MKGKRCSSNWRRNIDGKSWTNILRGDVIASISKLEVGVCGPRPMDDKGTEEEKTREPCK